MNVGVDPSLDRLNDESPRVPLLGPRNFKRRAGELQIEFMPDPRLQAMRERGAQHERAYIERLRETGSSIVDLRERRDSQATIAAMREALGRVCPPTMSPSSRRRSSVRSSAGRRSASRRVKKKS